MVPWCNLNNRIRNFVKMSIVCRICDQSINSSKGLTRHLLIHDMTFDVYLHNNLDQFPNYCECPICSTITKGVTCSMKCSKKWRSIKNKGVNIWERMDDLTKANAKKQISNKAKKRNAGVNIWERMDDLTKANAKKKLSKIGKRRFAGEGNPMFNKTHDAKTVQKIFKHRKQNNLEKMVAEYLDKNNVEYYFQFFINDTSRHSYDFKLKGRNVILEIDGDYWHGGPGCDKHSPFVEDCIKADSIKTELAETHGYELHRFWESDIKKDISIIDKVIN